MYQQVVGMVLLEAGNPKLAAAWSAMQGLMDKKEVFDLFLNLVENKDQFLKVAESI